MSLATFRARFALIALVALVLIAGLVHLTGFFAPPRFLKKIRHDGETFFTANPEFVRGFSRDGATPSTPPVWAAAKKPEGVRRVVILGDSAAAGLPLTDYHLGRLVEARWRARFPGEPVEVINISMAGADSRTLRRFAREAMALDPDLFVICAGLDEQGADAETDLRDIVRRALKREAKVLFISPAINRNGRPTAENDLPALQQKIASDSGSAVAAIDAARWLRGQNPSLKSDDGFFLDDTHLNFAGRVALAELTVDGMAALWGIAPRDESPEAVAAWWQKFPQAESEARRDTLFTAFDEYDMWSLALKNLPSDQRTAASFGPERRAALEEKVREFQRRAKLGWDTTDLIVAYERAQLQNPRDPLTHFTAGRLLGLRGEGERAVEAFQRGFALQPDNTAALLNYAAMQSTRGDTESARAALDTLQKFDPRAEGLLKMQAAVALREAELPEAAALLEKHLARNPADTDAWLTLSEIQLKLGDFPASEASRQKAKEAAAQ